MDTGMGASQSQLPLLSQHAAEGQELATNEIELAVHDLLQPEIPVDVKAEFLLCLARKGETPREVKDFATLIRGLAVDPNIDLGVLGGVLIDTCGTGADKSHTYNVSTATMFILAAAGIPVAKHGNRSVSSQCGSADVLEALGVKILMSPEQMKEGVESLKLGFLFAPLYHKTFKVIQAVREHLAKDGKRTIFNILGPLVNPADPNLRVVGVYDPDLTDLYAQVLHLMKIKRAVIVHGYNEDKKPCLDELSTFGVSKISQLHSNGKIETLEIDAADFGFKKVTLKDLKGGDAKVNAQIIRDILSGTDQGPRLDFLLYNASVGFVLAGQAKDIAHGIERARETIASGEALAKLNAYVEFSKK